MKLRVMVALALVPILAGCTSSFHLYKKDLFEGKSLLARGEFGTARSLFVRAAAVERRATAYAFAATASYKMNDLASAEGYIYEAERAEAPAFADLRISGYKALILLGEGKKTEGLAALKAYTDYYSLLYPLMTIEDVKSMWGKGEVDQAALEALLDEQILSFEREVEQAATTGTGFYSTRLPTPLRFPLPVPD